MYIPRADTVSLIQTKILEKLGAQRYRVWFKNATQFTVAEGHVKISAPNLFTCGWIERHFADAISEAVFEATGQEHEVSFVVEPKLQHAVKKHQLDSQAEYIAKNPERTAREQRRLGSAPPPRPLKGRFDDLVVGPANELALSVIRLVADRDPKAYSPVFIHGGCGLGKTHMLQALANELAEKHPQVRWAYVTGEEFTNAFVFALRNGRIEAFRQQYRRVDVLIIDDVHFLANKKGTQEEFLHTFNAIEGIGRQIVLASDSHPKLIGQFSEQLVNRFMAGMVVRIDAPDFRMRCEILRRRARAMSARPVPENVIAYIAEHLQANVRELEGALLKLVMYSAVTRFPINLSTARQSLAEHLHRTQRVLGLDEIDQTVATYFGLTCADLHTSRKTRTIALARGIAMYLARKHTDMSFPEIGRFMGNKNHSTVILANRKIEQLVHDDAWVTRQTPAGDLRERIRDIIERLEQQFSRSLAREPEALDVPPPGVRTTQPPACESAVRGLRPAAVG